MSDNGGFTSGNDTRSQPGNASWPTSPNPSTGQNPAGMPTGQYYSSRPAPTSFRDILRQLRGPIIGMIIVLVAVIVPIAITLIAYFAHR
jgi:hypothetical protein